MRVSPAVQHRQAHGEFARRIGGVQPARDHARLQRFGRPFQPITLRNATQVLLLLNLVSAARTVSPSAAGDTGTALQRVSNAVAPAAQPAWFGGADAAALPPGVHWIDALADLLGSRLSVDDARFELDIGAIVDATRATQDGPGSIVTRREATNQARMDTIARLFEDEGLTVETLPYSLSVRSLYGFPYRPSGHNLRVTLSGAGVPRRTLMLVAHGDVVAADTGSTGALDNGAGVAALLALARRLRSQGLPDGTRVQLLVTHQQKPELHGAKGYVAQCRAASDCPDMTLALDLLGRGNGITLSGSDQHVLLRDGDSLPGGRDATPVTPAEHEMTRWLRTAAAAAGLRVHDTPGWTLPSDHIAFQRSGLPALGISLMDGDDLAPERERQQAHLAYVLAEEGVDWNQYDAWLDGTLDATQVARFDQSVARADNATAAFQALPLSRRERLVGSPADQPGQVDSDQTLVAVGVLHNAVLEWLAAPRQGEA